MFPRGNKQTRALCLARRLAWVFVAVLGLVAFFQLRALVLAFGRTADAAAMGGSVVPAEPQDGGPQGRRVEDFAVIWQRMDPEPLEPEPTPEVVDRAPAPPPRADPYPEMRLLGTITEEGRNYALLQIKRGSVKLLQEGETFGDVRVLKVGEDEATVSVPDRTKTLRIERGSRF